MQGKPSEECTVEAGLCWGQNLGLHQSKAGTVSRLSHLPRLRTDFMSLEDAGREDGSRGLRTTGTGRQLQLRQRCRGRKNLRPKIV